MTARRQVFLRLAYDGTAFHGSAPQRAPDGSHRVRTVASEIEAAASALFGRAVAVRLASRTDAGVHARGQLAALDPPLPIPPSGIRKALDDRCPPDLAVRDAFDVAPDLDVRRDNGGKVYRYRVVESPLRDPFVDRVAWRVGVSLDRAAMARAAARFVGRRDFAGLRAADCQAATTVRTLRRVEVVEGRLAGEPCLEIVVEGDAFLKNMVRILAGTLVEVGRGRFDPDRAALPLRTGDRRDAGPTAPARGLTLDEVIWPRR